MGGGIVIGEKVVSVAEQEVITVRTVSVAEMVEFLASAKKQAWAGGGYYGVSLSLALDDARVFSCGNARFFGFKDEYSGQSSIIGSEVVHIKSPPHLFGHLFRIYQMGYAGGPTEPMESVELENLERFLQGCLLQVAPELPFRGPPSYQADKMWEYQLYIVGGCNDICQRLLAGKVIRGEEEIYHLGGGKRITVWHLDFHARVIWPTDINIRFVD